MTAPDPGRGFRVIFSQIPHLIRNTSGYAFSGLLGGDPADGKIILVKKQPESGEFHGKNNRGKNF
ncbi:MAG: hypothetical protein U5K27_09780 [Desulfotignum sp.]|nr:hypothetical protein [Desulfotignum sp.]